MGVLLDVLRSVEFLDAGPAVVGQFMALGKCADYPNDHVFWKAGAVPQALVVPVTGEAKTSTRNAEGREFIDRFLGCGDCIGLPAALGGLPHATDAEVTRAGEFFVMERTALVRFLDERPAARAKATSTIGALYRRAMTERQGMALRSVSQRLAEFLLRHGCARETDGARVLVHATQSDIAARLGTVREVVSRIVGDFQTRGLVDRDLRGLFVRDWDGLQAEAGLDAFKDAISTIGAPWRTHHARTMRFFLPMAERRRRRQDAEGAASCRARLGDLALCRKRGCPVALDDRAAPAVAVRPRRFAAPSRRRIATESGTGAAVSPRQAAVAARVRRAAALPQA